MKIGVFDSGVGGLLILKAIVETMPAYDFLYLGDTQHMPYGALLQEYIYDFTKKAVDYLFKKDCNLIILACNTASTQALRRLQMEYLPKHYPGRRILGVIIPTVESVVQMRKYKRVGVIATQATIDSKVFIKEFAKLDPAIQVFQQATPLLASLIESTDSDAIYSLLPVYLEPLIQQEVEAIVLGCTHYSLIKYKIKELVGDIDIISEDEIIPNKLMNYLDRHPEVDGKLYKVGGREYLVTELSPVIQLLAKRWFGNDIGLDKIALSV